MKQYEAMFLFKAKDAKEDWDGLVEHVGSLVSSTSGTLTSTAKWDEKKLAYDIKGQSRAAYMLVYFEAPPTAIAPFNQKCKLSDKVLRVLVVKDDATAREAAAAAAAAAPAESAPVAPAEPAPVAPGESAPVAPAESAGDSTSEITETSEGSENKDEITRDGSAEANVIEEEKSKEEEVDGIPEQGVADRESDEGSGA